VTLCVWMQGKDTQVSVDWGSQSMQALFRAHSNGGHAVSNRTSLRCDNMQYAYSSTTAYASSTQH
jgi:hypothetical protein